MKIGAAISPVSRQIESLFAAGKFPVFVRAGVTGAAPGKSPYLQDFLWRLGRAAKAGRQTVFLFAGNLPVCDPPPSPLTGGQIQIEWDAESDFARFIWREVEADGLICEMRPSR